MYLVVLCMLSVCVVMATLLHFIIYPNNITMFNFAAIGVAMAANYWLRGVLDECAKFSSVVHVVIISIVHVHACRLQPLSHALLYTCISHLSLPAT